MSGTLFKAIAATSVGLWIATGCGSGDAGSTEPSSATTAIVVEVGGPVRQDLIDRLTVEVGDALLPTNGAVEVMVVDGPNADVFGRVDVPGTTVAGLLDTESKNSTARGRDVEHVVDDIESMFVAAFHTDVTLDEGRDILGAIERVGAQSPHRVVVALTSGGVHRTSDVDFLAEIIDATRLDLDEQTELLVIGVGDVPVPDGDVPSRAFTEALVGFWTETCSLHGPNCEVAR